MSLFDSIMDNFDYTGFENYINKKWESRYDHQETEEERLRKENQELKKEIKELNLEKLKGGLNGNAR